MKPIRVALICDYAEEFWPSMDLVGQMISQHLEKHFQGEIEPTRIQPKFRRRLTRLPIPSGRKAFFNADRLLNRYHDYPRELARLVARDEFDVYHVVDHSYAQLVHVLPKGRAVVTCHDLDTFRCLLDPDSEPRPAWFKKLTRRTLSGLCRADAIACDSEATRLALLEHGLVDADRLQTIHLGTHPECSREPNPSADEAAAELLGPMPNPVEGIVELLHVGSNIKRKRIDVALRTLAGLRTTWPRARLIRIGGVLTEEQARLASDLGISDGLFIIPFMGDRSLLAAIYRRANVLLQPSDAEGFGLPLAEAIACGTPIVASDLPVLREVAGQSAEYCPVGDIPSWVETSRRVILDATSNPSAITNRFDESRDRYRWEGHVTALAITYRSLVARLSQD